MMVRESGLTSSLTQVPATPLSSQDILYLLTTLGNQNQAEKFSWLLPNSDNSWSRVEEIERTARSHADGDLFTQSEKNPIHAMEKHKESLTVD